MKSSTDRGDDRPHGRRTLARWLALSLLALVCAVAAVPSQAQSQPMQGDAAIADPPGRAARLSDVSGQVWLYNPDSNEWAGVSRNQPLTSGDRIATDNDGRAEITLGTTVLRLDAATELEIVRLDDSRYVVHLQGGSVVARLRNAQSLAEFELVTDEGRFRVQSVGRYRFDRVEQTSDVTVYSGQAIYENGNTALAVPAGQHAQFWLDAGGVPQYAMVQPVRDDFFAWNEERDRAAEPVVATRYVSPEMTGAEDLDRYGQWQQTPDYGAIWVPTSVPAGWAPYSAGHWAWVRPWGWTWVDDQRWGFAPFHYGRWVYHRNAWCWAPGTYVARPVYAPALVAWVGGPRVGASITIGGGAPVGWFPLAPREVYVPSYRASQRYVRDVNLTHVTNVTTITTIVNNRHGEADRRDFANRRYANAVTFVPSDVMTRRQPVAPAAARFRNDPQARAFVNEGRPAPVLTAPPVAAPPLVARAAESRAAPRPPFAGRPPGSFAGRPDGARAEPGRPEGTRLEAGRPVGARPEPGRPEPGRPDVATGRDGRGGPGFGGERAAPPRVAPGPTALQPGTTAAPPIGAPAPRPSPPTAATATAPVIATAPGSVATPAAVATPLPPRGAPRPSANAPGVAVAPTIMGAPPTTVTAPGPSRVVPPPPMQRGAQPGEAAARPGFVPRDRHAPAEAAGMAQAAPNPMLPTPPPGAQEGIVRQRGGPPRGGDGTRGAEIGRPAPPLIRLPDPAAVAAPPAPPARPVEAARPPPGEAKMTRPETPRRDEQRRDGPRDEKLQR